MPSYDDYCRRWFFRRHPAGKTFEAYEAESGLDDRHATLEVLRRMKREVFETLHSRLGLTVKDFDFESLRQVDEVLSAEMASAWAETSDPDDPNNELKLTLSEIAVFFGEVCIQSLGGKWIPARMPNYFESTVRVGPVEILVFDSVMKRLSTDRQGESLVGKLAELVRLTSAPLSSAPQ